MTISNLDPNVPDPDDPAGVTDDELRNIKTQLIAQFAGEPGDLYDIPITVGPRALNAVATKANQADLDALDARVSTLETSDGLQNVTLADHESRIAAIEGDYTTASEAGNLAWPVGSIFISADGANPTAKGLPGTWSAVGDGRVLLGSPTTGVTGGSNSVTLSDNQLPPHKHQHTTSREDSALTGTIPAVHRTNPNTTFSSHKQGTNASKSEYSLFNTDEGVGLNGDPVDITPAHLTVRFYQRTA